MLVACVAVQWQVNVHLDGPVKAFQALSGDAIVSEVAPVCSIVAIALQKLDVGLTDGHIIRGGVVVQLLMPVLHDHMHDHYRHPHDWLLA